MAKPANLRIEDVAAATARADLNDILISLASLQTTDGAGAAYTGEPTTTYPNMLWHDKATSILKQRATDNASWINVAYVDQSLNAFRVLDDTQVVNTSGTQTGLLGDQATATWEAGTSTTESLVSPAKVKAQIDALRRVYEDGEDATTSGATHDFTSIPAGVNEIDIFLDSVSATGSNDFLIQIGTGGTPTTTGYYSVSTDFTLNSTSTSGFIMKAGNSARTYTATMQLRRIPGTNKWQAQHSGLNDNIVAIAPFGHGYGALSGTLDNIRLRASGADTFDAGTWSIRCRA
jgi:hypothetical protein